MTARASHHNETSCSRTLPEPARVTPRRDGWNRSSAVVPFLQCYLGVGDLARMFRFSRGHMSRLLAELMAAHGLPEPRPGRPRRWKVADVEAAFRAYAYEEASHVGA